MVELSAQSACKDLLPVTTDGCTLEEVSLGQMYQVSPFAGTWSAVSDDLEGLYGVRLPDAGRTAHQGDIRAVWFGRGTVLLTGLPEQPDLSGAAVTDQSDAWACVELRGASAVDVLARLVPIDLRPTAFGEGATARSMAGHMSVSISRQSSDGFLISVFRSMAQTLIGEIAEAMEAVAARG